MKTVEVEKRRGIIIKALDKARTSVLKTDGKSSGSGLILIPSVAKEKERFWDYTQNLLEDYDYEDREIIAVFGFTNMTFGLGNTDNGLAFFNDGFFFSGSGGGYGMNHFFVTYEDFVKADSIELRIKKDDPGFGKRQVVCVPIGEKENLIDLAHTGCQPKAFLKFLLELRENLSVREEGDVKREEGGKGCGTAIKKILIWALGLYGIYYIVTSLMR